MRIRSLLILGALAAAPVARAADITPEQKDFFEGKVRPLLTEKCYKCHSIEQNKAKGGLALDTREALLKGGDSGPGVKPGNPEGSLLIKAISYKDADLQMPPKGEKLSDKEIADLTAWVKMGAPDPRDKPKGGKLSGLTSESKKHWAFQPVKKPEVPVVKNRAWCITAIDAFIQEKLEEKGLFASADLLAQGDKGKLTLLRRATYDLTGLPPTVEEQQAFLADQSPMAFSNVVDRLLASPAYGERWGRFWLDTARYADTTGERNTNRGDDYRYPYAYTYRDWVIKAFNSDMPYDQFIIQQLAADKVKDNAPENMAALGFLTVGEKFRNVNDVIDDRINTFSKGFLGLTVSCARCHDHMFDPIPTKDYYALHGVFASTIEPDQKPVLSKVDPKLKEEFQKKIEGYEQKGRDAYYKLVSDHAAMFREKAGYYIQAAYGRSLGMAMAKGKGDKGDGNYEALQQQADKLVVSQKLDVPLLNEVRRHARVNDEVGGPLVEIITSSNPKEAAAKIASQPGVNPVIAAAFKNAKVTSVEDAVQVYNKAFSALGGKARELLGEYANARAASMSGLNDPAAKLALAPFNVLPASELDTEGLREAVQKWNLQLRGRGRFDVNFNKVNELKITDKGSEAYAMVVADSPNPHDSPVFVRGQQGVPGDLVPRSTLEILTGGKRQPFKEAGSGRLELAENVASKNNPLTARVMVNRVWMHHFGQGFVRTPDDLGTRSEEPSHKELLNYLSWYYMEQGWSLKKLHKAIMLSRVYAESSYTVKEHEDIDPDNRYLWRANVRRLDFEAFRDSLLVMSKQLDTTQGGQPVNLTDEPYSYRRSIYGYIDRGNLPELLQNFDFANPEMPNSSRTSTIVPQQALFLMNSPFAVDVARQVIARPEVANTAAGADFNKVQHIYRVIYQRDPTPDEIKGAIRFVSNENLRQAETVKKMKEVTDKAQQRAEKKVTEMANNSMATKAIQNEGDVIERKPLTPWETLAQALLFSNEAAYIN